MAKKLFSAMLAHHMEHEDELRNSKYYPMYSSFKLDGIRGINRGTGYLVSRSDKPLPSAYAQMQFGIPQEFRGFDGELVVRDLRPGLVYKDTFSAVMTQGCETPLDWWVFDHCTYNEAPFYGRYVELVNALKLYGQENIKLVEQRIVNNWGELLAHEREALDAGFEGLVVRRPDAPYKYGRSTGVQQWMVAFVRHATSEAIITGIYEGLQNTNEAVIDSRGYTTRSKHLAQMVGKGLAGGFYVKDFHTGCEFKIGVAEGMSMDDRREVWHNQSAYIGRISKYKYKPYGMDVAPRQPVMLWGQWRDPMDM